MNTFKLRVSGIGWVLPGNIGSGWEICAAPEWLDWQPRDNGRLEGFSAKPYLSSVKGYLDPAGAFLLAAASLALGPERKPPAGGLDCDTGISTATRYGATLSGYRFYEMLVKKGPRLASPLVFPHGYANTAGNLAAIEFGFAGPHLVLYGRQDLREAVDFAAARLEQGAARAMLVGACESAAPTVLPDDTPVLNGAIVAVLEAADEAADAPGIFCRGDLWNIDPPTDRGGMVHAALQLLQNLPVG